MTELIPKGYKQTEVGVIPDDWVVKTVGEVLVYEQPGKYIVKNTSYNNQYDVPVLTANKAFILGYTPETANQYDKLPVIIFDDFTLDSKYVTFKFKIKSSAIKLLNIKDAKSNLKFIFEKMQLIKLPKSDHKRHYISEYQNIVISVPSNSKEEHNIAKVISDTDLLIEFLDKLIKKKKNIKQGAMQELLTGKRRLPGFKEDWKTKTLEEIGEISGAGVDKKSRPEEIPVRLLNYMDVFKRDFIYSKELNHWVTAPLHKITGCAVKKGDIFFTPSSEMRWDIGISAVAMEDMQDVTYSYHVDRLRLFADWDIKFRTYIFKTKDFLNQCETVCEGSGKRYVISLSKFRKLTIKYPKDKNEQSAIANILFDMDSEIEQLEKERDKYKKIKIGMMQELLTGRIRLK